VVGLVCSCGNMKKRLKINFKEVVIMQLTQKQIDGMTMPELLDNIELAIEDQRDQLKAVPEFEARLRLVLADNVEIIEEDDEEENNGLAVNVIRADKID